MKILVKGLIASAVIIAICLVNLQFRQSSGLTINNIMSNATACMGDPEEEEANNGEEENEASLDEDSMFDDFMESLGDLGDNLSDMAKAALRTGIRGFIDGINGMFTETMEKHHTGYHVEMIHHEQEISNEISAEFQGIGGSHSETNTFSRDVPVYVKDCDQAGTDC